MYKDFTVFDSHVHIYPDKIAKKASINIGVFYDIPMSFDGSLPVLNELVKKNGIDRCLVHSVATVPAQTVSINNFVADSVDAAGGKFVGFCTVHPDMPEDEMNAELDRVIARGLKGIKLHPDFQKFNIDDKNAYKIYELAQEKNLPILFHTGDKRWHYSSPNRLAEVLKSFPKLTVIGAHFGGWSEWDNGEHYLADKENVYVDTSSSFYSITPEKAKEYIRAFGEDRVFFGSDYPMWDSKEELSFIDSLDLSESAMRKILSGNLIKLLKLDK